MKQLLLALTMTPSIGWKTIQRLLLMNLDEKCHDFSERQWQERFPFLRPKQTTQLASHVTAEQMDQFERQLRKLNIDYVTVTEDHYPSMLKESAAPPWLLFLKGNQECLQRPSLAVVGSRKTTTYGRTVTEQLIPELVQMGWSVTSGLAIGTDTCVHQATLKSGGLTMAVLGCGVDVIYPSQNRTLYEALLAKGGLLVSEYPPGTKAIPGYFPQRNRIIAGMTYGTIVIEAAKKSGSLITAHYALECGREVFAIPGSLFDAQSVGTNLLIQQHGAKLVTCCADIFVELQHVLPNVSLGTASTQPSGHLAHIDRIERQLLTILENEKMHMNELLALTKLSVAQLSRALLKLEMNKQIKTLPGSYYQKIMSRQ